MAGEPKPGLIEDTCPWPTVSIGVEKRETNGILNALYKEPSISKPPFLTTFFLSKQPIMFGEEQLSSNVTSICLL